MFCRSTHIIVRGRAQKPPLQCQSDRYDKPLQGKSSRAGSPSKCIPQNSVAPDWLTYFILGGKVTEFRGWRLHMLDEDIQHDQGYSS